jgi:hypothetical protein
VDLVKSTSEDIVSLGFFGFRPDMHKLSNLQTHPLHLEIGKSKNFYKKFIKTGLCGKNKVILHTKVFV